MAASVYLNFRLTPPVTPPHSSRRHHSAPGRPRAYPLSILHGTGQRNSPCPQKACNCSTL